MDPEELKKLIAEGIAAGFAAVQAEATAAEAETPDEPDDVEDEKADVEDETPADAETADGDDDEIDDADSDTDTDDADDVIAQAEAAAAAAIQEANLARCELMLERKLKAANLSKAFRKPIVEAFGGKVFEETDLDKMIKSLKEAATATDTTGRTVEGTGRDGVSVTIDEADKKALMLMGKLMGESQLRRLETLDLGSDNNNQMVQTRVREATAYKAWINGGKPNINFGGRTSELLRTAYLNGGWYLDDISFREASTLATVIKNTVNIMTALDFAGSNRWYESIVDIIESDNPIDDLTIARLFGADSLNVVAKGAPYT